jgi:cysteine desulfurase
MTDVFGNPSSLHKPGLNAENELTAARKIIAGALTANPNDIIFTSGATEANAMVIRGAWEAHGKHKKRAVVSAVEHPSVSEAIRVIESQGAEIVRIAPNKKGFLDPDDFAEAVTDHTFLCSCMSVNNETGTIFPIKKIFSAVKRKNPGCLTHTDAVQAFMKLPIKASDLGADCITLSAHKIRGITGAGALMRKKGVRIMPLIPGGGQERGMRSGTEAVPAIAAFGAAVKTLRPDMTKAFEHVCGLNKLLRGEFLGLEYITINTPDDEYNISPYILSFSVRGIRSEIMLHYLENKDIYISTGSACSKGKPSGVLTAFGLNAKTADESIRVSFSSETSKRDITELVAGIKSGFTELQKTK